MKKITFIFSSLVLLATCCTPRVAEQSQLRAAGSTALCAYIPETKTGYTVDQEAGKAVFAWLEGDSIDAAVDLGSSYQAVRFVSQEAGTRVQFKDGTDSSEPTVEGLQAQYPAATLSSWAFYPSGSGWNINDGAVSFSLPSELEYLADNPLSVVPMFGIRDSEGDYAFTPMTAVLAIPVTNVTPEMDFISLKSESAALSGGFTLSVSDTSGEASQSGAAQDASGDLRLSFSGLSGDYTFYFPLPSGTIPAGLTITCGESANEDNQMSLTTSGALTLTRGRISRSQAIPFEPQQEETWTSIGTGRYLDDFLWKANAFPPYKVEVEIFRSSLNVNRYRIVNPYPVANKAFKRDGYTGDEFMYLEVDPSSGLVTYDNLVTGMTRGTSTLEDRNFAVTFISSAASYTKVTAGTASDPLEIQLGCRYVDSADETYYYTRANYDFKRLYFPGYDSGETWTDFIEGIYTDVTYDKIINGTSSQIGSVQVTIQKSSIDENRYRVANPYRDNVEESLRRSTYDEYLYFTAGTLNTDVYFEPFRPGVRMDSDPKELAIWHPVNSNLMGYSQGTSDFTGSSILTTNSDGSIKKVQLGAHYFDIATPAPGYCYTRHGTSWPNDRIYITFGLDDKVEATAYQIPMLPQFHNPVTSLSLPSGTLEKMVVKITSGNLSNVTGLRLWQNAQGGWMDSGYVTPDSDGTVTMTSFTNATVSGDIDLNFWAESVDYSTSYTFEIQEVVVGGTSYPIEQDATVEHRFGVRVNHGGDKVNVRGSEETVASFRIPALVTSNSGTLIAAYDVRYAGSGDLQADIDVGMKRSTDGGKTWSDLKIIMDMGEYGGYGQSQNGIGDPCLLVDENTGDIYCFALWAHGHSGTVLSWSGTGFDPEDTGQFMMVKSTDDGLTWSEPVNLTTQLKQYEWKATFQGPGRGITMKDGTLVIPMQHQENGVLNSGIAYSKDHGQTWTTHNMARATTSESAVAEIEQGVLMLSMRDETGSKTRAVYTTTDLGMTWTAHSTDKKIIEPTCEASLLHVDAADNVLGQDLLLFSNPHNSSSRSNMTIQASLDKGTTWSYSLQVDAGASAGYSCLTMIDSSTVGILYESSKGNILFQAIPLTDIIR